MDYSSVIFILTLRRVISNLFFFFTHSYEKFMTNSKWSRGISEIYFYRVFLRLTVSFKDVFPFLQPFFVMTGSALWAFNKPCQNSNLCFMWHHSFDLVCRTGLGCRGRTFKTQLCDIVKLEPKLPLLQNVNFITLYYHSHFPSRTPHGFD